MANKTASATVYFPGLDELRFLAALSIVIYHVEEIKRFHGFTSDYFLFLPMRDGVTFFFVLSGFLITYLLLKEQRDHGTVALGPFYMRRALRIWPVYYLVVLVGFFVCPLVGVLTIPGLSDRLAVSFGQRFALFMLFLPNLALVWYLPVPFAAHAWSIGVEEQFYLVWPLLVKYTRRLLAGMVVVLVGAALARIAAERFLGPGAVVDFLHVTRIGCMAIGGIGAWAVFHQRPVPLAILRHQVTQLAVLAVLACLAIKRYKIPYCHYEVQSLLFCCLILNAAVNPDAVLQIRSFWLEYLGKRSYGIYMYHPIGIGLSIWLLGKRLGLNLGQPVPGMLLYATTLALTIGLSILSFRYLETPFLALRGRFSPRVPADGAVPDATPEARAA